MIQSPQPWWMTDQYDDEQPIPAAFENLAGPKGVALVKAYADGKTDKGWGDETFGPLYASDHFNLRKALYGYNRGKHAFAFIMRSVRLVCVDIDGKNGGLEHAKKLGALPPTLAETSKSGNGYHLFYTVEMEWDDELGFGEIHDRIGIEQGVDIRATGCVYHHDTQRWNDRAPVPLPKHLHQLLVAKQQERQHRAAYVSSVLNSQDETEILLMRDQLMTDLQKPIPDGKRNNTLFAIGQQMKAAQIDGWEEAIEKRAKAVGLDDDEADKLVANITRFD
jgi:hypothetical protein